MKPGTTVALVTGARQGLGRQVAHELAARANTSVVITSTRQQEGSKVAESMRALGADVQAYELELPMAEGVHKLKDFIMDRLGRLDILINNAAVYLENPRKRPYTSLSNLSSDDFMKTLSVNVEGPLRLIQAFLPSMKKQNYGRIVNVSSGMGRFGDLDATSPYYCLSKLCLNGLTQIVAHEVRGYNILVNAVCPGWVQTDMGGPHAPRSLREGARGILWAALLPDQGPSGGFFRDGIPMNWCKK
jgi:NAD(P)-dependent dehydrogenase (short-subunit alcohol dehydrogenase family)